MSVVAESPPTSDQKTKSRGGRWIDHWEPENEEFWEKTGKPIARRNLIFSIFAENLGFSIWVLWSVVVLNLSNAGFGGGTPFAASELFWLTALPNLVGATLRIPYTFAVPKFGGRLWTTISAALLLIPTTALAAMVHFDFVRSQSHDTQFVILLIVASLAGVGGGNFSSSMANISFFYPEKRKGLALGLNAAGGNLGVATVQLLTPLVVIIGVPYSIAKNPIHPVHLAYAGIMWMPFIIAAVVGAWFFMDSLTMAKADTKSYSSCLKQSQTWVMSILYIGTFGSFIGFSFALPLVIKLTFPEFLIQNPFIGTYLAGLGFLGALIGSVTRPFGGWLSDRIGGAKVTLWVFAAMAGFTMLAMYGVNQRSFPLFFASYMVIFALSGAGNGSTYRMIPVIFGALGRKEHAEKGGDLDATLLSFKRQSAAVIGIAGAIGAFGGFLIQQIFRLASVPVSSAVASAKTVEAKAEAAAANATWSTSALGVFIVAYVIFGAMTWFFYLRKTSETSRVPSLAYAGV
ncbi:MFS transporter, NNP family, nitrate/nitrite transporter [Actinokineospora alba]|uniref:MFS transporter, NNP family, nitrate/nitrite transporter n=1 Tax=Actinokineospora alba TaxID=504798 RepID=A0A1H0VYQ4_9PSEU|nr:nitrate/nitrite transporter [Actinokineospora alba]TDP67079.1 NNP family nitrate/nitrite transporter-like MFS transporter [Actinokineospora alba]SDJ47304.1 MFS transporter, NNP family, nitrate/nitrite transporter [Actinokineospora alba]SDP83602.1 MFS transporter, NNP family, nitrate/nitrite transporter [Actinokineospora alba]